MGESDEIYEVVITDSAWADLERIAENLRETVSESVALKIRVGIKEKTKELERMPHRFGIIKFLGDSKLKLRRIIKWSYRIVFFIDEKEKIVYVLEINHVKSMPKTRY